jgi:CubicO group peptidase (beta-lactamase class C family)
MERPILLGLLAVTIFSTDALAQSLSRAAPEDVGLSTDRLERLNSVMQGFVDRGQAAGIVTLILRNGQIAHFESFGHADQNVAMSDNTIFRIASQSKAVTSVAIMMLVEEGKLALSHPVARYIPAFAKTTVAVEPEDGTAHVTSEPANRPITIRDLLTHTSGISYGGGFLREIYQDAGVWMWYFADKDAPIGTSIDQLASLPFASQPGERFVYGFSTDVLGRVVEIVSGMTLAEFVETRITEPLRMDDTHFYLPPEKRSRLAAVFAADGDTVVRAAGGNFGQGQYVEGPRMSYSGGAGLLSTASDYARFLQMLLNGGELDGVRLLSPKTVQLMTTDHIGDVYGAAGRGFGLGFQVIEDVGRSGVYGSVGAYGWGGAYHTTYWVDPTEKLVGVMMTQLLPPPDGVSITAAFRTMVYQAIVKSSAQQ